MNTDITKIIREYHSVEKEIKYRQNIGYEFLKILNTLGGENVFVISHKQDVLADKFKSTIKFQRIMFKKRLTMFLHIMLIKHDNDP